MTNQATNPKAFIRGLLRHARYFQAINDKRRLHLARRFLRQALPYRHQATMPRFAA